MLINSYRFGVAQWNGIADSVLSGSTSQNPYGQWSYGRKATLTSTTFTLNTIPAWQGTENYGLPLVGVGSPIFLHPGANSQSVIRWASPRDGNISIAATFVKLNTGATNGVKIAVYKNNSTPVYGPVVIDLANTTLSFAGVTTSVAIGDTIDFIVDNNGAVNYDHTDCTYLMIDAI